MKIGVDIDDVLAEFIPAFRMFCIQLYGKPELNTWPCDWGWTNYGLTEEQIANVWKYIASIKDFHSQLFPKLGTSRLRDLDAAHELYFITARRQGLGERPAIQTAKWLENWFQLDHPQVIVAANKIPLIEALDLDAFVDDRADTCEALYERKGKCVPYLLDAPHNKNCKYEDIQRVIDFNEFADRMFGVHARPEGRHGEVEIRSDTRLSTCVAG
jgi:uncharacterized HAD superfamily protein